MLVKAGKEGVHQENRQRDGKNESTQSQNMPSQRTSAPKASHYKVNLSVAAGHIKLYLGFAVVVIQVIMDCVITLGNFFNVLFVKMVLLTFCHLSINSMAEVHMVIKCVHSHF